MSSVYACPLSHQLISLTGADKLSYLHGQITQDLNKLSNSNYLWAGHCSAKGKLWGVFKLFSQTNGEWHWHAATGDARWERPASIL